jgi:hypothetical protein
MTPPMIRTLRQCRRGVLLRVICNACGHKADFVPTDIVGYVGRDLTFAQAQRLFKCGECKSKDISCGAVKPEPIKRWTDHKEK